jgi:Domain of unknown function (DUF1905)
MYPGKAAWYFVTLPDDMSAQIKFFAGKAKGFGSVRVKAIVGGSSWKTSVFPESNSASYLLPVKAQIRQAESLRAGDKVRVQIALDF